MTFKIKYNKQFVNYYNDNKSFKQQKIKPHVLRSLSKTIQGFINNNRTINNDIKLINDVDNATYEVILKVNERGTTY